MMNMIDDQWSNEIDEVEFQAAKSEFLQAIERAKASEQTEVETGRFPAVQVWLKKLIQSTQDMLIRAELPQDQVDRMVRNLDLKASWLSNLAGQQFAENQGYGRSDLQFSAVSRDVTGKTEPPAIDEISFEYRIERESDNQEQAVLSYSWWPLGRSDINSARENGIEDAQYCLKLSCENSNELDIWGIWSVTHNPDADADEDTTCFSLVPLSGTGSSRKALLPSGEYLLCRQHELSNPMLSDHRIPVILVNLNR